MCVLMRFSVFVYFVCDLSWGVVWCVFAFLFAFGCAGVFGLKHVCVFCL